MDRTKELTEKIYSFIEWLDIKTPKSDFKYIKERDKEIRKRLDEIKEEALIHLNLSDENNTKIQSKS